MFSCTTNCPPFYTRVIILDDFLSSLLTLYISVWVCCSSISSKAMLLKMCYIFHLTLQKSKKTKEKNQNVKGLKAKGWLLVALEFVTWGVFDIKAHHIYLEQLSF